MRRRTIPFLLTIIALVAGAVAVLASPTYRPATAVRPSPSPLLVIDHPPPTPTPAPTPTPTPAPTPAPASSGVVTFNVPVYKQLRNLDCETAALQMALAGRSANDGSPVEDGILPPRMPSSSPRELAAAALITVGMITGLLVMWRGKRS